MVSSRKTTANAKNQGSRAASVSNSKASLPPKPACEKRTRNTVSASSMPPPRRPTDQARTRAQRSWGRRSASWTPEEDTKLVELVNRESANPPSITASKTWSRVAAQLTNRTGKQCRERYLNQLKPGIRRDPWTPEEERTLREAHARLGNKWVAIANLLPGRTDNCVKNHWNSMLRKRQRREAALRAAQEEAAAMRTNSNSYSELDRRSEAENSVRTVCVSPSGMSSPHHDVLTPRAASPYTVSSPYVPSPLTSHRDSKLQISTLVASSTKELPVWRVPFNDVIQGRAPLLTVAEETKPRAHEVGKFRNHSCTTDKLEQSPTSGQTTGRNVPSISLAVKLPADATGNLAKGSSMFTSTSKFISQSMLPMPRITAPGVPQILHIAHPSDTDVPNLPQGRQVRRSSRLLSTNVKERTTWHSTQRHPISKPRSRRDMTGTNGLAALAAAASSMPPSPLTPESRYSGTTRSRSVSPRPRASSGESKAIDSGTNLSMLSSGRQPIGRKHEDRRQISQENANL